jgi:hypothetical protein
MAMRKCVVVKSCHTLSFYTYGCPGQALVGHIHYRDISNLLVGGTSSPQSPSAACAAQNQKHYVAREEYGMAEEHRKRRSGFFLHLDDYELDILKMKAREASMSRTQFIRRVILFGAARGATNFDREEASKLQYELNRIGNNINQIAYYVNANRSVSQNDFVKLEDELNRLLAAFENFVIG